MYGLLLVKGQKKIETKEMENYAEENKMFKRVLKHLMVEPTKN